MHYPAAFYTALLNNQPMGFYHPSTLVKDAQRRGVRFHPIDVQVSDWDCTVEADGAIRLGLRYVSGLREQAGRAIASAVASPQRSPRPPASSLQPPACHRVPNAAATMNRCSNGATTAGCSATSARTTRWLASGGARAAPRHDSASLDDLVARTGLRRDELVTLADIGALNAFGYDRRSALWQAERAVRPAGELFATINAETAEHAEDSLTTNSLRTLRALR